MLGKNGKHPKNQSIACSLGFVADVYKNQNKHEYGKKDPESGNGIEDRPPSSAQESFGIGGPYNKYISFNCNSQREVYLGPIGRKVNG